MILVKKYIFTIYANDLYSYSVPDKPSNLSVAWVTDSMMELSWSEPLKPNGKLEGYRIFYMQNNFTDVVTVKSPTEHMKFALMNLGMFIFSFIISRFPIN